MQKLPPYIALVFISLAFLFLGYVVYGASLGNQFVSWDDTALIRDNPNVASINITTLRNVFSSYDPELYIPLTFISYQIDDFIGGMNPFVFHLTNLVLHIINSLLVSLLLYTFLRKEWLSLALGGIFLLHPLNTEAVVWASSRKDLLSTAFFLLSLLSWMTFKDNHKKKYYITALLIFILGALSKVMVISLPIIFILLDVLDHKQLNRRSIMDKIPFFSIALVFGVIAIFGKTKILVASTSVHKILIACKATIFYLQKFFVPYGLTVMYPYTKTISLSSVDFYIPTILSVLLFLIAVYAFKKNRMITFGILFYLITLIPTFTNFSKGGNIYFASDRYAYLPMIGLLLVIGVCANLWIEQTSGIRAYNSRRKTVSSFIALICCLFAYLSFHQALTWKTGGALYENVLKYYPNAHAARNNLGMEYLAYGDYDEALNQFDLADNIKLDSRTQANRAAALVGKGLLDEAFIVYQKALAVDPELQDALYGLGNIEQRRGQFENAAIQYRKTLALNPDYTNALNNLGAVYLQLHDWDNAISVLESSIMQRPDFIESYYNLAGAYEQKGMKTQAEEMYRRSLTFHPADSDALANVATLLYEKGDIEEAAQYLQSSLNIDPTHPTAINLVLRMRKDGYAK